jgi:hypothetical protein
MSQYRGTAFEQSLIDIDYKDKYTDNIGFGHLWTSNTKYICEGLKCDENSRILDVGSGVGKFCLEGGFYFPNSHFTGIEIDIDRHNTALKLQDILSIYNCDFIFGSFEILDFSKFNRIYFFNPLNMGALVVHNNGLKVPSWEIEKYEEVPYEYENNDVLITEYWNQPIYKKESILRARNIIKKVNTYIEEMNLVFLEKIKELKSGSIVYADGIGLHMDMKYFNYDRKTGNYIRK